MFFFYKVFINLIGGSWKGKSLYIKNYFPTMLVTSDAIGLEYCFILLVVQ
jgi:hypothetical protein